MSACSAEACRREPVARGLCLMHYKRQRTSGELLPLDIPTTCTIDACEQPHPPKGLCSMHSQRQRHYGRLDRLTFDQRFWEKVARRGIDDCWPWIGARLPTGYGRIHKDGRGQYAHRVAYEILVAPIPAGLVIDHLCCNTSCCNPAHMEPVTSAENTRRFFTSQAAVI